MATTAERLAEAWESPSTVRGVLATVDHKTIGKRYLVTAFVFLILGGLEAALMRAQLARPESSLLTPEAYNQLFTMHGITMLFWYASPVLSGFGNYLIPLVIGSRDMAFPRLNAFSYWVFLLSGVFLYAAFAVGDGPHGGWFAYPPYTSATFSPTRGIDVYALALLFLTVSTTAGAINFIVTIFTMRCPGMTIGRMPLMAWSTLTTSMALVFSLPSLTAALLLLELDRRMGTHFYDAAGGGHPLLWQHLFWVFGHPWVYVLILPATGMVSMILPVFCRRPIVGHTWVALATVATGIAGFGVWVHHMFATGIPSLAVSFFSAGSLTVSIPSGIQVFAWLATIWSARRHVVSTSFLFVAGFLALFFIGGASGVMTALVPFDWQATDSYFVVAHLHYVLVGLNVFPVIAAAYFWLPKITGRLLDERVGRWNFWLMFVGMNVAFFPMHIVGLLGMPRRVYTYAGGLGWDSYNLVETVGAYLFAAGVLVFFINAAMSIVRGASAGNDPWQAASLEWSTPSPPPPYNFAVIPVVAGRDPLWSARSSAAERWGADDLVLAEGRITPSTSVLDGEMRDAQSMPEDSLWPLTLSVALGTLCAALLVEAYAWAALAAVGVAACVGGWLWPHGGEVSE